MSIKHNLKALLRFKIRRKNPIVEYTQVRGIEPAKKTMCEKYNKSII